MTFKELKIEAKYLRKERKELKSLQFTGSLHSPTGMDVIIGDKPVEKRSESEHAEFLEMFKARKFAYEKRVEIYNELMDKHNESVVKNSSPAQPVSEEYKSLKKLLTKIRRMKIRIENYSDETDVIIAKLPGGSVKDILDATAIAGPVVKERDKIYKQKLNEFLKLSDEYNKRANAYNAKR